MGREVDMEDTFPGDRKDLAEESMHKPEEASDILRLWELGYGTRRIATDLGISRNTVRKYLRDGGWREYRQPKRSCTLDGLDEWLEERMRLHRGNADVVRQELEKEKGVMLSLRTVERAVSPMRTKMEAEGKATIRFETPPGRQLQIDFGQVSGVDIGGERETVHLFVATLGWSRRRFAAPFRSETQTSWFEGIERCFRYFEGIPEEVVIDNARSLVSRHDAVTREVELNGKFRAFADYWGFRPFACAPYRAQTKGKAERSVGYVKGNCIAGRSFTSWDDLEGHIVRWLSEVADVRINDTTGEAPGTRYIRQERNALKPVDGKPPFLQIRELHRKVHSDGMVEIGTNRYSVPWRLAGRLVCCRIAGNEIVISTLPDMTEVARHGERKGRRETITGKGHLAGIVRNGRTGATPEGSGVLRPGGENAAGGELLRPLSEYQAVTDGESLCEEGAAS